MREEAPAVRHGGDPAFHGCDERSGAAHHLPPERLVPRARRGAGSALRALRPPRASVGSGVSALLHRFRLEHPSGRRGLHQCVLPLSGSRRRVARRRLPDRTQRGLCYARPRDRARAAQDDPSGAHRARPERVGGIERDDPFGGNGRRRCHRGGGRRRYAGRAGRDDRGGVPARVLRTIDRSGCGNSKNGEQR